jgi:hypothetical protein
MRPQDAWGPGGPITKRELDELRELERRRQRREKIGSWFIILAWLGILAVIVTYCARRP